MARSDLVVWIDLEMTGLEPERDRILEIATVITDGDLAVVAEGPELVIHQPEAVLAGMNAWCLEHHDKSGLTERVRSSTIGEAEAEARTLGFIAEHCAAQTAPLGGNSVYVDHAFLSRHMQKLAAYLHPDVIVDVTTLKELARRWHPEVLAGAPKKRDTHRALEDIHESIRELAYYRRAVLV